MCECVCACACVRVRACALVRVVFDTQQRCYCGTSQCRQVVGGRHQKTAAAAAADSLRSDNNSDQLCSANTQQLISKVITLTLLHSLSVCLSHLALLLA